MQVQFYDVVNKLPLGNARQVPSLNQLLASSDVVSLHVPETGSTQDMIGAARAGPDEARQHPDQRLPRHRGRYRCPGASLESGPPGRRGYRRVPGGAALQRRRVHLAPAPFDNTFLTPHIGGSTVEAQENIGMEVAEKLARYSDNGTTTSSVNFPEVALPEHAGSHRLLHIHHNVPGIMSAINNVFSETGVNVSAQYLQTTEEVGYVVIDVDAEYSDVALQRLAAIEGTIRSRVLF